MEDELAVYLASSFRYTKPLMREYRSQLAAVGVRVTSRWIDSMAYGDPLDKPDVCAEAARECIEDITVADTIVYFTEHGSVGKHVEFGYALARGKRVVVVGEPTSVFQFADGVERFPTWGLFFATLGG